MLGRSGRTTRCSGARSSACDINFSVFDFGRTDLDNEGLRTFKSNWGTVETELVYSTLGDPPAAQLTAPRVSARRNHPSFAEFVCVSSASAFIGTRRDVRHSDRPPPPGRRADASGSVSVGLLDRYRFPYSVVADDADNGFTASAGTTEPGRGSSSCEPAGRGRNGVPLRGRDPLRPASGARRGQRRPRHDGTHLAGGRSDRRLQRCAEVVPLPRDRRQHLPAVRPRRSA